MNEASNPTVRVTIEIPRGSFLKRGSNGHLDFISPFPCPFNYGSIAAYIGGEGDLLDAVVLGPTLRRGAELEVHAYGAVGLSERGMYDDKVICSPRPLTRLQRSGVLLFFKIYGPCKSILNAFRGRPGPVSSRGWGDAHSAIARAIPTNGVKS